MHKITQAVALLYWSQHAFHQISLEKRVFLKKCPANIFIATTAQIMIISYRDTCQGC